MDKQDADQWKLKQLAETQKALREGEKPSGTSPDRFESRREKSCVKEDKDVFAGERDISRTAESAHDDFIADEELKKEIERALKDEIGTNLPPVYVQSMSLLQALLDGRPLLKPLSSYIVELRKYIRKQKSNFESLPARGDTPVTQSRSHMLEGLSTLSEAIDIIERGARKRDLLLQAQDMLVESKECFYMAKNVMLAGSPAKEKKSNKRETK